jgi:hypothetical protein
LYIKTWKGEMSGEAKGPGEQEEGGMGGDLQGQEGKMAVLTHLGKRSHEMWKQCI